jgi:hypothetical protein
MKKHGSATFLCVPILLLALSYPAAGRAAAADSTRAAAETQPALWAQAVKIFEANKDLVPGKVLQKIQELEDNGRVKSQTDIDITLSLDGAGKIRSDVVRASKDGKDITAEERKKAEKREKKEAAKEAAKKGAVKKDAKEDSKSDSGERSYSFSMNDSPLNPERQNDVRVTEARSGEMIDGARCICFDFSYPEKSGTRSKVKPATIVGKAWIDESSGRPIKLEYASDPLPKHVKSMTTTLRYGMDGTGPWVLKQMVFDVRAAFLVIKKKIHGDFAFSDYWKYEEPAGNE